MADYDCRTAALMTQAYRAAQVEAARILGSSIVDKTLDVALAREILALAEQGELDPDVLARESVRIVLEADVPIAA
jgi:hypothetical protein